LRRLRRKGRDFRGLSGGSLLLTLRGMFFSYFSNTRELNTVAAIVQSASDVQCSRLLKTTLSGVIQMR
ncbi:hypothetical protein, partial [Klebsiella pneumoniae]|uniref:hypothetical protein n=1 Tax=Klebsiella pneumoniae TaxID=573 RepID=UPI0028F3FBDE